MQDRPTADELLAAVQAFLESDVLPELRGRKQFLARVAANVLAIVRREFAEEEEALRSEWQRLAELYPSAGPEPRTLGELRRAVRALTQALCEEIRTAPRLDNPRAQSLWQHVWRTVNDKLRISNPSLLQRLETEGTPVQGKA